MRKIDLFKSLIIIFLAAIVVLISVDTKAVNAGNLSMTSAQGAVLMEAESKRVLYEVNAGKQLPMASTTKILTALVAIKNADLDKIVAVPKEAQGIEGSSIYLRAGEHLTIRELLYGLMLQSGNDSAVAIAVLVGGSIEKFAGMMNSCAKSLGAVNSNFTNPHGLADKNHYTTAFDLALISSYAMQDPVFAEIVGTKSITISNEGMDYKRLIINKNKILTTFDGANGVKTGFTKQAGRCFVGAAKRGGLQLIAVVLNCGPMFEDSKKMMEFGFANYEFVNVTPNFKLCGYVEISNRHNTEVGTIVEKGVGLPLTNSERLQLKTCLAFNQNVTAPMSKGTPVGKLDVYIGNQLIFSSKVVTMDEVN